MRRALLSAGAAALARSEDGAARYSGHLRRKDTPVDSFQIVPHFAALGAAYVLALPIAWDREKGDRSAGLRTFPLVAVAACGFIQAAESLLVNSPEGIARIVEGVITGIGFIGGGAILKLGSYDVAVAIAAMTFLTLKFVTPFKVEEATEDPRAERDGDI
jgi:putative Mg2+ transporter-C (MgtC) family protein